MMLVILTPTNARWPHAVSVTWHWHFIGGLAFSYQTLNFLSSTRHKGRRIFQAISSPNFSDHSLSHRYIEREREEAVGGEATICCSTTKSQPSSISTCYIHLQVAIH